MRKMILRRFGNNYRILIWGTSTKHPDFIYTHSNFIKSEYDERYWDFTTIDNSFIQWLSWIAAHQIFECQAIKILNAGFQIYNEFPEDGIPKISDILNTHVITWENNEVYAEEIKR